MNRRTFVAAIAVASLTLLMAPRAARAASYTWTQTAAGTYVWTTTSNWAGDAAGYPSAVDDVANLTVTMSGAQTINLIDAIRLGTLNLGDTSSPFVGTTLSAAAGSLVMDVSAGSAAISKSTADNLATDTIAANIQLADNLLVTNSATAGSILVSGTISGAGRALTKDGVGLLVLSANNSYTGATTLNAGTLQVGSWGTTGALSTSSAITGSAGATLAFARSNSVTQGTDFASVIGGSINLTQAGAGSLILNGANTYTGTTTVMGIGTLQIGAGGAAGAVSSSSPLVLGGALGGGTLFLNRSGAVTQAFAGTTLNAGASTGTAAATNTINFGAITRNVGATLNIGTTGTYLTSTTNNANGILGSGIVYGGTSWAVATSGTIQPLAAGSYTTTASAATTAANYADKNIDVTTSAGALSGAITPNSIRFHSAGANTVTLAANTFNTVANGILVSSNVGNNAVTITGGTIAGSSSGDLVVVQNNTSNTLTISSAIANNGAATALTKSGAGSLVLSTSNSYTGGTYLNAGTLSVSNGFALGSGTLQINSGTLNLAFASQGASLTANNTIVVNNDFGVFGGQARNTGTGQMRLTRPVTVSTGGNNDEAVAGLPAFLGTVISNPITDINGGNTLNAFDVTWSLNNGTTSGVALSGSITLRSDQRANLLGLAAVTSGIGLSGNIGDGGNGFGLTFVNGGAPSPLNAYGRGPGVIVTGSNSYTGPTVLEPGAVVALGKSGTIGSFSPSSQIINNGIFSFYRSNTITQGTDFGTISGGGQVQQAGGGRVILTAANTYAGMTYVNTGILQVGTGGTTGSLATVGITGGSGNIAFNRSNTVSQGTEFGSIVGPVVLSQIGSGTLALNGPNGNTGRTAAGAGTIALNHNLALQASWIDTGSNGVFALGPGVTSPWLGGLGGSKNLNASVTGNYNQLTSLTLNVSVASSYDGVIADGDTPLNVVKLGSQTQTLTAASTYTGTTTIVAGVLSIGSNGSTGALSPSSPIVVAGGNSATLQFNRNNTITQGTNFGSISGAGNLTQAGGGTTILTSSNSIVGLTTISSGNLQLGSGSTGGAINPAGVILNNATLIVNRSNDVAQGTDFSAQAIVGTGALTKQGTGNLTLNTPNLYTGNTLISGGKVVLGDRLALQNSAYDTTGSTGAIGLDLNGVTTPRLGGLAGSVSLATAVTGYSGVTELTLNPQSGRTPSYSGIIADGAAGMNLTKDGLGTQTLTGSLTYTGTTTIRNGTLTVNRQTTGALTSTSPLTFTASGGTFNMDNTGASGALSQSLGTLTFGGGDGTVRETRTAAQNQLITFSSLATRSAGATGNFALSSGSPSATNGFVLTGQATGLIDQGMYFNGGASTASYAYYDSTGFVRAVAYGTDPDTATSAGGAALASGSNVETTGGITAQTSGTYNTIRIQNTANSAQAFTQSAGSTLTVNGILRAGNGGANSTTTISGGTLQPGLNAELVIRTDMSGDLITISSPIVANGVNALTKSGAGTLSLSSSNSYTGGTYVNGGTLYLGNARAIGTGTLTINGGIISGISNLGTLANNNVIVANADFQTFASNTWNLGTGAIRITQPLTWTVNSQGGGSNTTAANVITDGTGGNTLNALDISYSYPTTSTSLTLSGSISLRGNQILRGNIGVTSSLTLSGNIGQDAPGYGLTFATTPGGSIFFNGQWTGQLTFSGSASYTGTTTINPGVTLQIGSGGATGSLSPSSPIVNNGRLIFNRSNTATQGTDFASNISGIGEVAVKAGTLTLSGSNTFTGPIGIYGGVLSFNSIQNAGVNSPIGAYPFAGAGSMVFGDTSGNGTFRYTGPTASSNRGFTVGQSTTVDLTTAGVQLTLGDSTIGAQALTVTGGAGSRLVVNSLMMTGAATLTANSAALTVNSLYSTGFNTLTLNGSNTDGVIGDVVLGGATVVKSGAGRWTLTGLSTAGTTSIQGGTLAITGTGALWAASPVDITASGAAFDISGISASGATIGALSGVAGSAITLGGKNLTFGNAVSTTFSGTIAGAGGGLTKQGSGTATLSGVNTFSGTTRIAAGTLAIGSTLALQNSTLDMNAADSGTVTFAQNSALAGLTGTRNLNMSGVTVSIGGSGTSTTYAGSLLNGSLTKVGSGTLTLTGSSTYAGTTTINAGSLQIGDGGTAGAILGSSVITGSSTGTLVFNRSDDYGGGVANPIQGSVNVLVNGGLLPYTGTLTSLGTTTVASGTLQIGNGGTSGALSGNVTNNATVAFNRSDASTFGGVIGGSGEVVMRGSGSLTLSAVNTYSGPTVIESGTLVVGIANAIPTASTITLGGAATRGFLEIDHDLTIGNLVFTGSGGDIVNGSSGTATFFSAGTAQISVLSGNNVFHANAAIDSPTVVDVADGAEFTFHNNLFGNATLTKTGSGTMTLTGDNDQLSGSLIISGGRVNIGPGMNQLGTSATVLQNGAILDLNGQAFTNFIDSSGGTILNAGGTATTTTITGPTILGGTASLVGIYAIESSGSARFEGVVGNGASLVTVTVNDGGQAVFANAVSGSANITVNAGGTAAFGGTVAGYVISHGASTFDGSLLSGAEVQVQNGGSALFTAATNATSTVTVEAGAAAEFRGTVAGLTTVTGSALFTSTADITGSVTTTAGAAATLDQVAAAITGALHNDGTLTVNRSSGSQTISGGIAGTGELVKLGAGTLVITAANTFAGTTTLSEGTLVVDGELPNAVLNAAAGTTLMGSGTIGGLTTIAGLHSPGNSPAVQTFANLTYTSTSSILWELWGNTTSNSPLAYDQIVVTNDLTFTGTPVIDLVFTGSAGPSSFSTVAWSDAFWASNQEWLLYDVAGTTTDFLSLALNTIDWQDSTGASLSAARPGSTFSLEERSGDIYIIYAAVPEPGTLALAVVALAGAAWGVSRRRSRAARTRD